MATEESETKVCPMCGETVKAVAKICRFCGENFSGNEDGSTLDIWREGKTLVMGRDAKLPYVCVKTNQPADRWLKRNLTWHHPLIYLAILSPCIYIIVALIAQKRATIEIGLCQERATRRFWTLTAGWLLALLAVAMIFAGFLIAGSSQRGGEVGPLVVIGGFVTLIVAGVVGSTLTAMVTPTKITADYIYLRGVHPDFLARFPEFEGE